MHIHDEQRYSRNGGKQILDGKVRDDERSLLDGDPLGRGLCGHFGRRDLGVGEEKGDQEV